MSQAVSIRPNLVQSAAIRLVFFMEAVAIGAWLIRIPDVKNNLDLSPGELGVALIGLPLGTLAGFTIAAIFVRALSPRMACVVSAPVYALAFILVGYAQTLPSLVAALFVCGLGIALIEVAMNTKAGNMEAAAGRRIMVQCHGFWSLGSVAGALIGGAFSQYGVSVADHFLIANPVMALVAIAAGLALPPDATEAREAPATSFFALPPRALLLLCLMPVGIMGVEGAIMEWSAVFAREDIGVEPFEAAYVLTTFGTVMSITRLGGDWLATRFGAARVVLVSSLAAALGAALFAASTSLTTAILGAMLAGFGVATVYPLAVSAAAASPGRSAEANVAAVSFIAFSIFLAGPPIIGFLAELFGLRMALLILVPAALASAALYRTVAPRSD